MNFYMPVRLYTGASCVLTHKDELERLGKRCLIVTGRHSAKASGALDDAMEALNSVGVEYTIFDGVSENPTVACCMEAGNAACAFSAQWIMGIGGGSPLDAAKSTAVFAANPGLSETEFYQMKWSKSPLPIALIGTTAGTGSEVTDVSVLTDSALRKHSIHDPRVYAHVSFGDARYTVSASRPVMLSTAIDTLAHCTESYFSKKANAISFASALQGLKLMLPVLDKATSGDSLSQSDRTALYDASILGGMAISVTSCCFPHNVGYLFTEKCGWPHGFASALLLPDLIDHAYSCEKELTDRFFAELRISQTHFIDLIHAMLPDTEINLTDAEIESALPRWEHNRSVLNTVGTVRVNDIEKYIKNIRK